jgi:pyrroline-5-carboxylate reductase
VTVRLQLIGGGRMGEALLGGLIASGWADAAELRVVEKVSERADALRKVFPDVDVADAAGPAEGSVIAVKPGDVAAACRALVGDQRVLSIAAGVTLARLEGDLPSGTPVIRAMPNTPALIGAGAAAIAPGSAAGEDDLAWAESILAAVGTVVRVDEPLLDAVTGLSGSGPAYVFLVAEALIDAGERAGLPRDISVTLATQTLLGAARLLVETGDTPEALRAQVTSPGGTTEAGIGALEDAGFRDAIADAVAAATERSRELGQS